MSGFNMQVIRRLIALETSFAHLSTLDPVALSHANGTIAATSATTGAMTVAMTAAVQTITPTGNCTFNASGGAAGQRCTFIVTTSGTTSYTLTFGTNFKSPGTLATGASSGKVFTISFVYNGTNWCEISRTTAM